MMKKLTILLVSVLTLFNTAFADVMAKTLPAETELTNNIQQEEGVSLSSALGEGFVNSADANEAVGTTVSVTSNKVTIHVNRVGTSGTAQVYMYAAEEYHTADPLKGLSKLSSDTGTLVGTYTCGTTADFEISRYTGTGADNLFNKFYVVQNGKILSGPVYATSIESFRSTPSFKQRSIKGLIHEYEDNDATIDDLGISTSAVNVDVATLIMRNEDDNGKPIDNSKRNDTYQFESNGETFYFSAEEVRSLDKIVSYYSAKEINVTFTVISWRKTSNFKVFPSSLVYTKSSPHTQGFNTSNERGMHYWIATIEFLADRYSKNKTGGIVNKFVVGNELDYAYDWCLLSDPQDANGNYVREDLDVYMEEYTRGLRLANLAVKKYNDQARVYISLTHNWADAKCDSYAVPVTEKYRQYNSYAPKSMLDWMGVHEKARGDYNWGICTHPYPIATPASNPLYSDLNTGTSSWGKIKPITGDWRTSTWITCVNLELYQQYLEQPVNMYNNEELRDLILPESCIVNKAKESCTPEEYARLTAQQAATAAMYYYKAANLSCISEMDWYRPHDYDALRSGLMEENGTHKPSYDIWKYIDTDLTFAYSNRYLHYIKSSAESYYELMDATGSGFDWAGRWNEANIIKVKVSNPEAERSLEVNKNSFASDEPILVTAKGALGDWVGLFKNTDDISAVEPIYRYPVVGGYNGITFRSGREYDLLAYSEQTSARTADAALKVGTYKLVLHRGDNNTDIVKTINITSNYSLGSSELKLSINKTEFKVGENIITTASGGTDAWVGLYKVGDVPGQINTIYWYYCNRPDEGQTSGKPTIIQTTTHNAESSNPGAKIMEGEYYVALFEDSGYKEVEGSRITFTIIPGDGLAPLESIDYKLSNNTDGFANGTVTVVKNPDSDATECLMYWADASGKPLEGYTALSAFKLTGDTTVHPMYDCTIIPEGAKKLIAYAYDGSVLSKDYVSVDLPANSDFVLGDDYDELQIISDIHVTVDSEQVNEVRLSNAHFSMMLHDISDNSPNSLGIFINGDLANTGKDAEFQKIYTLYNNAIYKDGCKLPLMHISIGNHDWIQGNPASQFQKYVKLFNPKLPKQPENIWYDEEINGYHFVYLGGEQPGLSAVMSTEQLQWFDNRMAEICKENSDKPIFVFLHQSMYNTVAGSLPGQGWDGVANEAAFKNVLKKYDRVILLNGHSHWELNSLSCMYPGDEERPTAFNTAAVGYLWSSYNIIGGEFWDGSHGYYVRIYDDKVVFMGRDWENSLWIPGACFVVYKNTVQVPNDKYTIRMGSETVNLSASGKYGGFLNYLSLNPEVATVTSSGIVVPKKVGTAEIVITAYGTGTSVIDRKTVTITIEEGLATRFVGSDRYQTSMLLADQLKEQMGVEKFDAVILANGTAYPDALTGCYLAAQKKAPILLTNSKTKNLKTVCEYIYDNLKEDGTVYILGGEKAVDTMAEEYLSDFEVVRLKGDTRYFTNLEILKAGGLSNDSEILICTGTGYADSLSVSSTGKPILLVKKKLTAEQKAFLGEYDGCKFTIIGGTEAVTETVEKELKEYGTVTRINGSDRYDTAVQVAKKYFNTPSAVILAYSLNYPDGLCAGPLAYQMGAPVILAASGKTKKISGYISSLNLSKAFIAGGTTLIDDETVVKLFKLESGTAIRVIKK